MMNTKNNRTGVVILAAGLSIRMGQAKAFLKYNEHQTFIERILQLYGDFGCDEYIVVTNSRDSVLMQELLIRKTNKIPLLIINEHLEYNRFYSVQLGVQYLKTSEYCFIQNIDNPLFEVDVLHLLFANKIVNGYTSPRYNEKGGHPMLIGKDVLKYIKEYKKKDIQLNTLLSQFICKKIEVENDSVLININTPNDYKKYFNNAK